MVDFQHMTTQEISHLKIRLSTSDACSWTHPANTMMRSSNMSINGHLELDWPYRFHQVIPGLT